MIYISKQWTKRNAEKELAFGEKKYTEQVDEVDNKNKMYTMISMYTYGHNTYYFLIFIGIILVCRKLALVLLIIKASMRDVI